MSEWVVRYYDFDLRDVVSSRELESKESAISRAAAMNMREGEPRAIIGPNNTTIEGAKLDKLLAAARERIR
ncbi:hypothetical protein [Methylosinus sp. RM1]|uniref:hypothetical protein n=1 Tax=Methylosinus sp. RM1 TaxID=2583817 RepID=UPI00140BF253|nr:hypothetical protein [Methylosinus sp. RM1]